MKRKNEKDHIVDGKSQYINYFKIFFTPEFLGTQSLFQLQTFSDFLSSETGIKKEKNSMKKRLSKTDAY